MESDLLNNHCYLERQYKIAIIEMFKVVDNAIQINVLFLL